MIEFIQETGSTNMELVARLQAGEHVGEGFWLVADRQTAGRGRRGRAWFDGAGNFMGSTVIHLSANDPAAHSLALAAGLAVQEAVLPLLPDPSSLLLKWPNDLLLRGAKLSGILMERVGDAIVLGIGVNLVRAPQLPKRATIAIAEVTAAPDRDAFANALGTAFDRELERWRTLGPEPTIRRWLTVAHPEGTPLAIQDGDGEEVSGAFAGLAEDGSLLLRLADGMVRAIHAGDVMLIGQEP